MERVPSEVGPETKLRVEEDSMGGRQQDILLYQRGIVRVGSCCTLKKFGTLRLIKVSTRHKFHNRESAAGARKTVLENIIASIQ
jgi:hypothetical protein